MNYKITNKIKYLLALALVTHCTWNLRAQCPQGYLAINQFNFERDTVYYGSNTNVLGDTIDLYMDVYAPVNDTFEQRPLIIFAFGGGFVSGERNDFIMTSLCQEYARKGYVAATMDYRLFPDEQLGAPDSLELIDANVKAVSDMKAAIRFFRQSADNGNPYRIDPDFIVVGGYSAGAFTALHHTYLNKDDQLPPHLQNIINDNGGFQGNTGDEMNRQYTSEVSACINFAGALYDTTFLDDGESPVFSYHGTEDAVVPISMGQSVNTVLTMGSALIAQRADHENVPNVFHAVQGAGHVNMWFYVDELNAFMMNTNTMLREMYCPSVNNVVYIRQLGYFTVYPNPASDVVQIQFDENRGGNMTYRILSINGKIVDRGRIIHSPQKLDLSHLQTGVYWIEIPGYHSRKIFLD